MPSHIYTHPFKHSSEHNIEYTVTGSTSPASAATATVYGLHSTGPVLNGYDYSLDWYDYAVTRRFDDSTFDKNGMRRCGVRPQQDGFKILLRLREDFFRLDNGYGGGIGMDGFESSTQVIASKRKLKRW